MSEATDTHNTSIRDEFAHQADSFARSQAMSLAETLGAVVELVPEDGAARWAELACGPGLIARAMAPRVGSVLGLDLTPEMIEKARAEAAAAGVENVSFELGDATALDLPDDSFDTDDDGVAAAWHEEIERLLAPSRLAAMAERVGLEPDLSREIPFTIDFDEWIGRGSGGPANAELIDSLLVEAPPTAACFVVRGDPGERTLSVRNSLHRWRVPS